MADGFLGQWGQGQGQGSGLLGFLNSRAALQMGMGLLSGQNDPQAWANAMKGYSAGAEADQEAIQRAQQEAQRKQLEAAVSNMPGFNQEERTLLGADPTLARQVLAQTFQKKFEKAPTSTDITEFEYAKRSDPGFKMTFPEFLQSKRTTGTAAQRDWTIGKIPEGQQLVTDAVTGERRLQGIPGYQKAKGKLSPVAERELFKADATVQAGTSSLDSLRKAKELNKSAYSGAFANESTWAGRNIPGPFFDKKRVVATTKYTNIVQRQALEQLKATFGGAPTDSERATLFALESSVEQSPEEREAILDNAITLAQRRIEFNKNLAQDIRSGSYYNPEQPKVNTFNEETDDFQ